MEKIKLFVDPQGNAQILTNALESFYNAEPDVFNIVECNDDEYKLVQQGALWIDGRFIIPKKPNREVEEQLNIALRKEEELRKALNEINKEYITALIDGDEELIEELKAERLELLEMGV